MPYAGQKPDGGDDPGLSPEVGGGLKPPAALRPDSGSLFSSGFSFFRIRLAKIMKTGAVKGVDLSAQTILNIFRSAHILCDSVVSSMRFRCKKMSEL